MSVPVRGALRVLDFDCEARCSAVWYDGKPTWELTAIAAAWVDDPQAMEVWLLGRDSMEAMLDGFRALWEEADMVSGHNIKAYDNSLVNGHLIKYGREPLSPKLSDDTKTQYLKRGAMPASQEYIAEMLGLAQPKIHMSIWKWEKSNRLLSLYPGQMVEGLAQTEERVTGDVKQHIALRATMRERGLLGPPRVWRP
jgi:hypothetical protein